MSCSPDQAMKYDFFDLFMNLFINQNEFGLFILLKTSDNENRNSLLDPGNKKKCALENC